jgi:hypothetical protein
MKFNCEFFTSPKPLFSFLTIFCVALIVWVAVDIDNRLGQSDNLMTVSGTSEVYAKPDLALATFSVVSEAKTVAQAMTDNTGKMNAVIAFVKGQGVEEKDLKTTNFNIYPRYEYRDSGTCSIYSSYCPSGERVLVGYEVNQSLQVKMRDLTKIGAIVQGATTAGANQMSDLQFTMDNEDALKDQARTQAIAEAKAKAKTLAKELRVRLVKVVSFSENGYTPVYYPSAVKSEELDRGGVVPDVQVGENKISSTVSITYKIR